MAVEKVSARLVMETDNPSFKKAEQEVQQFARDTKKALDPSKLSSLENAWADLIVQQRRSREELKKMRADFDAWAIDIRELKKAETSFKNLSDEVTEARRKLNNFKNTWDETTSRLQNKFDKLWNTTIKLKNLFVLAGAAIATWAINQGAQKVRELSDAFTNLNNRLRQVAEWEQLNQLREKIFNAADEARVGVEDYASAFVRFDLVNKQLWGSQQETLTIMDSLTKWLSASGAAWSEVSSVMLQLAQAFGSWRLAGDEFRSVSENMPILLDILAKKLGVARGELKEMAADGLITSEVLKEALIDANEQLNESFDKTSVTIGQAMTQATNKFIKKYGEMDEVYSMTKIITSAITKFWDFLIGLVWIIGYFVNTGNKLFNAFVGTVWTLIIGVWETFVWVFKWIYKNASILVENIWIAFWNLPELAKAGLNLFLKKIEETVNKAISILNKIPKVDIAPVRLNLGVWWGGKKAFKSFENTFDFSHTIKSAQLAKTTYDEFTDSLTAFKKVKDEIGDDKLRGKWDSVWDSKWKSKKWGGGRVKSEEETQKKLEELRKKEEESLKRRNDWKKDQIEQLKKAQDSYTDTFTKSMKESEKNAEKFRKNIDDLKESIVSIDEDLEDLSKWKSSNLAERSLEIEKEIKELIDDKKDADGESIWTINEKIKKLKEEQNLISQNVSQWEIDEARKESELSYTEKYLREYNAKKQALEDSKSIAQQELADYETKLATEEQIYANLSKAKEVIEERYADRVARIEAGITEKVYQEAEKRITALERVHQKAIQFSDAIVNAGNTRNTAINSNSSNSNTTNITNNIWDIRIEWGDASADEVAEKVYQRIEKETDAWSKNYFSNT